jgi:hypothetical protein
LICFFFCRYTHFRLTFFFIHVYHFKFFFLNKIKIYFWLKREFGPLLLSSS